MPSDLVKRVDLDLVFPPFYQKVLELLAVLRKKGIEYWATDGFRTYGQQQELYAQGRVTKSPSWSTHPPLGLPVTNARPGQSSHNFGLAFDFCRDRDGNPKNGLQPDWNLIEYAPLAFEARERGLDAAYFWTRFREGPHVQLNYKAKGITEPMLKAIFDRDGLPGVWTYLDTRGPW